MPKKLRALTLQQKFKQDLFDMFTAAVDKGVADKLTAALTEIAPVKRPGRPPGSKNKPRKAVRKGRK